MGRRLRRLEPAPAAGDGRPGPSQCVRARRAAVPRRGAAGEGGVCMVEEGGRGSLGELRLSIDHLRAAAVVLARGGWKDVSSLWSRAARAALDTPRRVEGLLAGVSPRRDPQLSLIDLPGSVARRLPSPPRKARPGLVERRRARAVARGA